MINDRKDRKIAADGNDLMTLVFLPIEPESMKKNEKDR